MRFRKQCLGLPKDHCWTLQDWADFSKLDSKQLAEELQVPVEQVEDGLFLPEEWYYAEKPLPVSDSDLGLFVGRGSDGPMAHTYARNPELHASMFRSVFGKSAEEFVGHISSWQDDCQKCVKLTLEKLTDSFA